MSESLLFIFFIAFVLSSLGSLPTGMITLAIMQHSIESGKRAGIMMALGATIPEFVYTFIALWGFDFFYENIAVEQQILILATLVFFVLGIYFLQKKATQPELQEESRAKRLSFTRGLIIAFLNLLIIPFWVFLAVWLKTYEIDLSGQATIFVFSIGSALGALVVFWAYAELGEYILKRLGQILDYSNKIVGIIFIGLGIYQLIQLSFF